MLEKRFITGLKGVQVIDIVEGQSIIIQGKAMLPKDAACPHCQFTRLRVKATVERSFRHALLGQRLIWLQLRIPKLLCKLCRKYFMLRVPGILPYRQSTDLDMNVQNSKT